MVSKGSRESKGLQFSLALRIRFDRSICLGSLSLTRGGTRIPSDANKKGAASGSNRDSLFPRRDRRLYDLRTRGGERLTTLLPVTDRSTRAADRGLATLRPALRLLRFPAIAGVRPLRGQPLPGRLAVRFGLPPELQANPQSVFPCQR